MKQRGLVSKSAASWRTWKPVRPTYLRILFRPMRMTHRQPWLVVVLVAASAVIAAAPQQLSQQVRSAYVSVDAPVIALTNARVIDGTGGPPREGQTIVIKDGVI